MRADRLISIILLLQSKPLMTAKDLAKELEVSERTIYRDIDALCSAGVPIHSDAGLGGGFSLPPDYRTKADGLNRSDIQALFLLMNEQPFKQLGIGSSLKSALLKIFNSLPQRLQEDAEWIQNRLLVDMEGWSRYRERDRFLSLAQQAVWEQRAVRMRYTDREQRLHDLELDPFGLVLKAGIWFIIGRVNGEGQVRSYRLSRIRSMQLDEHRFDRPEAFRLESFWRHWTERFEQKPLVYEVVLEADEKDMESIIQRSGWVVTNHPESSSPRDDATARRTRVLFENEDAALSAIMAHLGNVVVVSPASLRARIYERATALASAHA